MFRLLARLPVNVNRTTTAVTVAALALTLAGTGDAQQAPTPTVIIAGRLLDPVSGRVQRDMAIHVEGGRVTAIMPRRASRTAGAREIDLSRLTVLPGLIDAHVHLALAGTPRANALATVRAGFTTVADLGARTAAVVRLGDAIAAGETVGPTTLAAGLWIGTAGGICEFGGIGVRGDTAAFRRRVRENVALGAGLIKVCVSGWLRDAYADPGAFEITEPALRIIVDEAHGAGRKVVAHALSLASVRAALRAGVDGLAHGALVDSATAIEMRRRGMFVVSTLASLTQPAYTGTDVGDAERRLAASVRLAHEHGVTIVFGTDAGVLPHGDNAREFEALTSAGLPPLEAIRAATVNAARALGLADRTGRIAVGMPADMIAVDGDPLGDVSALRRVRWVMRAGQVARDVDAR